MIGARFPNNLAEVRRHYMVDEFIDGYEELKKDPDVVAIFSDWKLWIRKGEFSWKQFLKALLLLILIIGLAWSIYHFFPPYNGPYVPNRPHG